MVKKSNIKWHFKTNQQRMNEIKRLKESFVAGQHIMESFLKLQERAIIISLKISWRLAKHIYRCRNC